jgi:diguanylate cyclase (GGDEF)-like protein
VRASDPVGRFGAHTFAVALRAATREGAAAIASKLLAALGDHPYETRDGGTIPLRARIGSAAWRDDALTAEELLYAADRRIGEDAEA